MRNLEEEGMARRVHLHMDLNETDASLIKTAAKNSRVQPSHYVLNRVLRVAELEIKEWRERRPTAEPPEDIDAGGLETASGAASAGTAGSSGGGGVSRSDDTEETLEDHRKQLARYRKKKGPDFRVTPLI